jgi:hypothetical protein
VKGLWKQLFQTRDEEVCSNVKQQLVRVQNKALHDDGAITDTALLYNDNVFELPLAKTNQKKEILISNSLLEIFDRYLLCEELIRKGDSITAFLVEHNDVLYKVIKANTTNDKRSHQTNIFKSSVQLTTRLLTLYSRMK